jgi:chemotaxis signal transduction protein
MEILRCLLLPIYDKTLIVPYAAVAEVVTLTEAEVKKYSESKDWVGEYNWRGLNIPLVRLEMYQAKKNSSSSKSNLHIAVINRMLEGNYPDFVGIVLQSVPVMHRYKPADLEFVAKTKDPYLLMEVKVRGQTAFIPNIPWMADNLTQNLKKS